MKRLFSISFLCCFWLFPFLPQTVFTWGSGHDTMGRVVAAILPELRKSLLQEPETMARFIRDNHFPNSREPLDPARVGEQAVRYYESMKVGQAGWN